MLDFKLNLSVVLLKANWLNIPILDKITWRLKCLTFGCLEETYRDIEILKIKSWEKIYYANTNLKKLVQLY